MTEIHVGCPVCNNGRLFDVSPDTDRVAVIQIKCPRCRNIVKVKMNKFAIITEQITAQ